MVGSGKPVSSNSHNFARESRHSGGDISRFMTGRSAVNFASSALSVILERVQL